MNTLTLATEHMDRYGPGPWWPIFPLMWLLFLALVVTIAIVISRRRRQACSGPAAGRARLAERFAAGEIDADEYRERLAVLTETKQ